MPTRLDDISPMVSQREVNPFNETNLVIPSIRPDVTILRGAYNGGNGGGDSNPFDHLATKSLDHVSMCASCLKKAFGISVKNSIQTLYRIIYILAALLFTVLAGVIIKR